MEFGNVVGTGGVAEIVWRRTLQAAHRLKHLAYPRYTHFASLHIFYSAIGSCHQIEASSTLQAVAESSYPDKPKSPPFP